MRKEAGLLVALVVAVIAAVVYGMFDPASSAYFPRCGFKVLTGYDCPGCGSQRALHALLHGDISAAWGYNAFLVALLPLVAILLAGEFLRVFWPSVLSSSPLLRRTDRLFASKWFVVLIALLAFAWWIGRNL